MPRRCLAMAVAVVAVVAGLAACGTTDTIRQPGDECTPARSLPEGTTTRTIWSGGQERSYLLHVPPGYDGSTRAPLLMLFHGLGGTPEAVVETTQLAKIADDRGAVLVAPAGRGVGKRTHWDFRKPVGDPRSDLHLVRDLLREVRAEACVDPTRTYAAGFSNGSALTLALACDGSLGFAAYGAVSAPYYEPRCSKAPPAPVIYFHGLADKVVAYRGARTVIGPLPGVDDVMADWSRHDRCPAAGATTSVSPHVRHFAWTGCADGSAVSVYVVTDGGHRWPGGRPAPVGRVSGVMTQEIDASALMWGFFSRHRGGGQ